MRASVWKFAQSVFILTKLTKTSAVFALKIAKIAIHHPCFVINTVMNLKYSGNKDVLNHALLVLKKVSKMMNAKFVRTLD
jgi:hypothetical protein